MKNSCRLLALAIALPSAFASQMALAQGTAAPVDLRFYGHLHLSTDYLNDGNAGGLNVASNASRLGFHANHRVSDTLEIIAQMEKQVDFAEGRGTWGARDTVVGLRGEWGTIRVGHYQSPTMAMLSSIEEFRDRVGDGRNLMVSGLYNFDRRLRSGVHYESVNMNGLVVRVHYGTTESFAATTDNEDDVLNASVTYQHGNWTVAGGYQRDSRFDNIDATGMRFTAMYSGDGWRLAGLYQTSESSHADGLSQSVDMTGYGVTGRYQLSSDYWLRAQVFHRTFNVSSALYDGDSTGFAVGIDRNLSSQATLYLMTVFANNGSETVGHINQAGHGKSLMLELGEDPFAISAGIIFRF
ncbi:MAG: porin [Idiomarina sp.]|nr:porin [Idiomarina sp.]